MLIWDLAFLARLGPLPMEIERWYVARARERLDAAAAAAAIQRRAGGRRQLLIDVSVIRNSNAGTGIQRVVRAVLMRFLENPPDGYDVRLVAVTRRRPYRYLKWQGVGQSTEFLGPITVQAGDVFLGLDLSAHMIPRHFRQLGAWKSQGVRLHFTLYDILALKHPEWFSPGLAKAVWQWFRAVTILADSILCISPAVETEVRDWHASQYRLKPGTVATSVIPMGSDFQATLPSTGLPVGFDRMCDALKGRKFVLMVGTVEPRKGHAQVVAAFEAMWRGGDDTTLIVVGRPGWKTKPLQTRMRALAEASDRLIWLENASDEALEILYKLCDGVVMASLGEGFGLPLIEALGYGKPLLVRDLEVFRSHARKGIVYFSTTDAEELADIVVQWLEAADAPEPSDSRAATGTRWDDTVAAIVQAICK